MTPQRLRIRARQAARVAAIKQDELQAIEILEGLPDNPRIIRRDGSSTFSMKMRDLGKGMTLSPRYHDFQFQYGILIDIIRTRGLDYFVAVMGKICNNPRLNHRGELIIFHKEVLQNVSEGLGL